MLDAVSASFYSTLAIEICDLLSISVGIAIGIGTRGHGLPRFYNFSIGIKFLLYKSTRQTSAALQT